jgi:hypothetical protein
MSEQLIFVSCGQLPGEEQTLGLLVKAVIDGTPGFRAYFAQAVQDLDGLSSHVFDAIKRCAGAVVVLHERGTVTDREGQSHGHRSSVWVNQEIGVLAYRQFFEARSIPILAFADPQVRLEGAMTSMIVNPRPLGDNAAVVEQLKAWLANSEFTSVADEAFYEKWRQLDDGAKTALASLLEQGGHDVKEPVIRNAMVATFGLAQEAANQAFRAAKGLFMHTDLVKLVQNLHSGDELSVHPTWEFHLQREIARWRRERKP